MSAKFESVFKRFLVLKNNLKLSISFMETHSYDTGVKKMKFYGKLALNIAVMKAISVEKGL